MPLAKWNHKKSRFITVTRTQLKKNTYEVIFSFFEVLLQDFNQKWNRNRKNIVKSKKFLWNRSIEETYILWAFNVIKQILYLKSIIRVAWFLFGLLWTNFYKLDRYCWYLPKLRCNLCGNCAGKAASSYSLVINKWGRTWPSQSIDRFSSACCWESNEWPALTFLNIR